MFGDGEEQKINTVKAKPFSESEKLKMELQSFGFYFSKHPISLLRRTISSKIHPINKLNTSGAEKFLPVLINQRRVIKKGTNIYVFLEVSDETGIIDVSVPLELYDAKKLLFKENSLAMIKGNVVADDYRKDNVDNVGIKIRASDISPIDIARSETSSKITLNIDRPQLEALENGVVEELLKLNANNGVEVYLNFEDNDLNLSSELKVDSFKISLEDSTFEKLDKLFGEENYTLA